MVRHWRSYLLQLTGIYLYVLPWDSVWFRASGPFEGTGFFAPPQHEQSRTSTYWYIFMCTAKRLCDSMWLGGLKVLAFIQLKSRTSTYWYTRYIFMYCQEIVWFRVIGRFEGTGFYPAEIACLNLLASSKVSVWFRVSASWWDSHLLLLTRIYLYVLPRESVWFLLSGPFEGTGFYPTPPSTGSCYNQS